MLIGKYGKKAFLEGYDKLHARFDFEKTREIPGRICVKD